MNTPDRVTRLEPGEIFVFGSNAAGMHGAGAALIAYEQFGAEWGVGSGLTGRTYALPTMGGPEELHREAAKFVEFARRHQELTFYLTKVGCGIAGFAEDDVAPLFTSAPDNVIKPSGW